MLKNHRLYNVRFADYSHELNLLASNVIDASKKALRHPNTRDLYAVEKRRKPKVTDIECVTYKCWID